MRVVLIRHSKTAGNLKGRYIGTTDEPLCEEGREALQAIFEAGLYPMPDVLYGSNMAPGNPALLL